MATSYTSLLGFALPVQGELSGTWGDVVNNSITQLVEDSVAGSATADVTSGNWTLTTTGSGAANEARSAILIPTGTPGTTRNIVAPSSSKAYIVDNQSNGAVVIKGSATTGTTIAAGEKALVAWNGSDFVTVSSSVIALGSEVSGTLPLANGGTGASLADPNADRILFWDDSAGSVAFLTAGSGLSISGTTITATGSGGTVTSVGMSVPAFLSVSGSPITGSGTLAVSYSGTALPVANGGTGATTLTANSVILGNGTSAVQSVAPGTVGNVLTSDGTTWTSAAASGGGGAQGFVTQATGVNVSPGSSNDSFALI